MNTNFIVKHVSAALGIRPHELSDEKIDYALRLLKKMDARLFKQYDINDIGPAIGNILADAINKKFGSDEFDMHQVQVKMLETEGPIEESAPSAELMPTAINITNVLGVTSAEEFKLYINPESAYSYHYIVLDTAYRNTTGETTSSVTRFTWNYAPTQNVGTGYCNSVDVIQNIVSMRIYQPRIPYVGNITSLANRVSILVEEFATQAYIGPNNRRYHFLLRPQFSNPYYLTTLDMDLLIEDQNDGIFNFKKPINNFSSLTVSFGNPYTLLSFPLPFNNFIIPFEFICLKSNTATFANVGETFVSLTINSPPNPSFQSLFK